MRGLTDMNMDGLTALENVIAQSEYGSVVQAVASLSLFSHPDTVAQTEGKAIFPIIRDFKKRGTVGELNGQLVGYDDNWAPTAAFMWANGIAKRGRDLQFNHIYAMSDDPNCYTALPNITASPAFLAKLTDTHPAVKAAMEYRTFELYGWLPPAAEAPHSPPDGYTAIIWPDPLPPQPGVIEAITARLLRRAKDRITLMSAKTGWLGAEPMIGA